MKTPRCLILSKDEEQVKLIKLTLREYGVKPRVVEKLEMLGPLSAGGLTQAWFIDLDGLDKSVTEISSLARSIAPDSRIIFFCSSFTRELAQECLRERAAGLLVKPFQVQRLAQTISSFQQEPELLDREDFIPGSAEPIPTGEMPPKWTQEAMLRRSAFSCPVCLERFNATRFLQWMFPVREIDTDFCPVFPKDVFPELYLMVVCPECFYANTVGRFDRIVVPLKEKRAFLNEANRLYRGKMVAKLDFSGIREFYHGLKSFDLARLGCSELQYGDWETFSVEYLLKTSWLCRRMGKKLKEQEAQIMALQHYLNLYRPYLRIGGSFPRKMDISSRLPAGKKLLRERAIIVSGFLTAELSFRLGINEQAEFYFDEVLRLPFLKNYPFLFQHIQRADEIFNNRKET